MSMLTSPVGRKFLMALSGLLMLLFVVAHLAGNSTIFVGPEALNGYAGKLHGLGPLVWVFRLVMLGALLTHVVLGAWLTWENWAATPTKYRISRHLQATLSSKTMIWTGAGLLAFLTYHLLQFTLRVTPDIGPQARAEVPGDVFGMVSASFASAAIAGVYVVGMGLLFLHLRHGIQSFLQTLGLSNDRVQPRHVALAKILSVVLFVGFAAIPALVLAGILSR